jgi:hypothetical protein
MINIEVSYDRRNKRGIRSTIDPCNLFEVGYDSNTSIIIDDEVVRHHNTINHYEQIAARFLRE